MFGLYSCSEWRGIQPIYIKFKRTGKPVRQDDAQSPRRPVCDEL
jgi:hypothetical protein